MKFFHFLENYGAKSENKGSIDRTSCVPILKSGKKNLIFLPIFRLNSISQKPCANSAKNYTKLIKRRCNLSCKSVLSDLTGLLVLNYC